MTIENVIETLIVLAVIGAVAWYVMPEMKATNIFIGEQRYAAAKKPFPTTLILIISTISRIAGICLYKFDYVLTLVLFKSGFRFLAASFVTIIINRSDFTLFRNFKYVLMVWLSIILVAPFFIILFFYTNLDNDEFIIRLYSQLMYYANGVGIFTLGVLTFIADYICYKKWSIKKMRFFVLATTEFAITFTFLILMTLTHYSKFWVATWLIYSILIILPILFYKMDLSNYEDEELSSIDAQEKVAD